MSLKFNKGAKSQGRLHFYCWSYNISLAWIQQYGYRPFGPGSSAGSEPVAHCYIPTCAMTLWCDSKLVFSCLRKVKLVCMLNQLWRSTSTNTGTMLVEKALKRADFKNGWLFEQAGAGWLTRSRVTLCGDQEETSTPYLMNDNKLPIVKKKQR